MKMQDKGSSISVSIWKESQHGRPENSFPNSVLVNTLPMEIEDIIIGF